MRGNVKRPVAGAGSKKGTGRTPSTKVNSGMNVGDKEPLEEAVPRSQGRMPVLSGLAAQQGLIDRKKAPPGFTLIELTIVLVVMVILTAIATPNYLLMSSRAKESKVKECAHCVQLAAELYATENHGIYAAADEDSIVADIVPLLPGQQRLKNPFSGNRTEPIVGPAANPGEIGYQARVGAGGVNEGYIITGFGRTAMVITLTGGS
jgi:prepilin-type N-terminal cleavage/methylation domain-containing protein